MRYLELEFYNMAPLKIGNDDTSQPGQTDTVLYIPGSTIRGLVIHALTEDKQNFEGMKKLLFSDKIHFMNAYVKKNGKALIPSFKGFYEDKKVHKEKKEIENVVVNRTVSPGTKRAALGHYCYPEGDCIVYADVAVETNLNINRGREGAKTVFRSQYICQGQYFSGYITFDDSVTEDMIQKIQGVFSDVVYVGNSRCSGYGACRCVKAEIQDGIPYAGLREKADRNRFYLVLLSNMTMRNHCGQMTGIDLNTLAGELGCDSLKLVRCATSVAEVQGYNRSWRGPVPSMVMYEAGSVFCLETEGGETISAERFTALEEKGIGIRKNEGFGQILFFDGYEKLRYKQFLEETDCKTEEHSSVPVNCKAEQGDIRIAARGLLNKRLDKAMEHYIVENPLKLEGISNSKRGIVLSLCLELRYVPSEAKRCLTEYINHSEEKDSRRKGYGQKERQDVLHEYVRVMLEKGLPDILKIPEKKRQALGYDMSNVFSEEELLRRKLQLMIRQIRYANREAREYGD